MTITSKEKKIVKGFSTNSIELAEKMTGGETPSVLNDFGLHYYIGNVTVTIIKEKHKPSYEKEGIEIKDNKYKKFIFDF